MSGALSGSLGAAVSPPTDLIKVCDDGGGGDDDDDVVVVVVVRRCGDSIIVVLFGVVDVVVDVVVVVVESVVRHPANSQTNFGNLTGVLVVDVVDGDDGQW